MVDPQQQSKKVKMVLA
jgi:serine/threonine protein kinase